MNNQIAHRVDLVAFSSTAFSASAIYAYTLSGSNSADFVSLSVSMALCLSVA